MKTGLLVLRLEMALMVLLKVWFWKMLTLLLQKIQWIWTAVEKHRIRLVVILYAVLWS
jgi:hypothetical protein